jgi:hypothetical protein
MLFGVYCFFGLRPSVRKGLALDSCWNGSLGFADDTSSDLSNSTAHVREVLLERYFPNTGKRKALAYSA